MKAWIVAVLALGVFGIPHPSLLAQEQQEPLYGSVGFVALRSEADPQKIAFEIAKAAASFLAEGRKVNVRGEVRDIPRDQASPSNLRQLATEGELDALAVFEFSQRDDVVGFVEVSLLRSGAERIGWKVNLVVVAGQQIRLLALGAAGKIVEWISNGAEVYVVLTLHTVPGKSNFTFGPSKVSTTDRNGYGFWQGTAPPKPTVLRVFKGPEWTEWQQDVDVKKEEPYFARQFTIELKRHP